MFLNLLLSRQLKNSLGLLIPSRIDCFSSLWFYHSPCLHSSPWAPHFHPADSRVCSTVPWELHLCLPPGFSLNVAVLRSLQTTWQQQGCVVLCLLPSVLTNAAALFALPPLLLCSDLFPFSSPFEGIVPKTLFGFVLGYDGSRCWIGKQSISHFLLFFLLPRLLG